MYRYNTKPLNYAGSNSTEKGNTQPKQYRMDGRSSMKEGNTPPQQRNIMMTKNEHTTTAVTVSPSSAATDDLYYHQQLQRPSSGANNQTTTTSTTQQHPNNTTPVITEAQLRWAQFHHKRVAERVRRQVERLYQTPRHVQEVKEALPDDENSVSSDDDSDIRHIRKSRPKISRGRRALLRVSKREYEQRRAYIAEHGYRGDDDGSEGSDDALDAIFAAGGSRKRRRRRRRRIHNVHDKERLARFEAAFFALLHTLQEHEQQQTGHPHVVATKKWTRPEGLPVFDTVDGKMYSDLKWGVIQQSKQKRRNYGNATSVDTTGSRRSPPGSPHKDMFTDAMREQLTSVAKQYLATSSSQHQGGGGDDDYHHQDDDYKHDDDEVASFVEMFEQHLVEDQTPSNVMTFVARLERGGYGDEQDDDNYDYDEDDDDDGHVVTVLSPTTADLVSRFEGGFGTPKEQEQFVRNLVAKIEEASQKQILVNADGKLHKAEFAQFIRTYLSRAAVAAAATKSPRKSQNSGGPNVGSRQVRGSLAERSNNMNTDEVHMGDPAEGDNNKIVSKFVKIFMERLEQDPDMDSVIDSQGTLNKSVCEQLLHRYLTEASRQCLDDTKQNSHCQPKEPNNNQTHARRNQRVGEAPPSRAANFFGRIRNATGFGNFRGSAVERDEAVAIALNGEANDHNAPIDDAVPASNNTTRTTLAGTVSNKVGELFHNLKLEDGVGLEGYSAFRQAQEERRASQGHDAASATTMSSFHALPAGIRKVVKGFRLSPRKEGSGEYEDDDSEHKDMEAASADYTQASEEYSAFQNNSHVSGSSFSTHDDPQSTLNLGGLNHHSFGHSIIDTDGSMASEVGMSAERAASLMLNPTIITKRHQQAIRAVEDRKWDQVTYLLSANPWLAEMADVNTDQYVLHKLALYGAGQLGMDPTSGDEIYIELPAAPDQLSQDLVRMFPSSVYKFDQDGNLPLHMAAASANYSIIRLLGDRFASGASVRNEDGMLPLHLAILGCAAPIAATYASDISAREVINAVTEYFPGALAIADNEGNLPIHTAASVLSGEVGVDVIYFLLDEAEREVADRYLRFRSKKVIEAVDDVSVGTVPTNSYTDLSTESDDTTNCLLVRNEAGQTPLTVAIYARAGWEVIEALACRTGVLMPVDSDENNALHLLVSEEHKDPAAAFGVLKAVPEAATVRNINGMLPIEIACMQMLNRELILALVLVDLPIDLDQKENVSLRKGCGGSWWYLACECDDHYVDIVEEVVSLCSFAQVRALTSLKDIKGNKDYLLGRATPKCKKVLARALRFVGRYEFLDSSPILADPDAGLKVFEALDFGTPILPAAEGRHAILKCFSNEAYFQFETRILAEIELGVRYCEDIITFTLDSDDPHRGPLPNDGKQRFFIAIEQPDLTLSGVLRGMLVNEDCQNDPEVRRRYATKVFSVLRLVAKALRHLHSQGFVHGDLCLENCGKFDDIWKLSDVLGAQRVGKVFARSRMSSSAPPEAVTAFGSSASRNITFRDDLICHPSIDAWEFGKLAFEVLVGDSLLEFDVSKSIEDDHDGLAQLLHWEQARIQNAVNQLGRASVLEEGIALIAECLSPDAGRRPSMEEVLSHPVWERLRRP